MATELDQMVARIEALPEDKRRILVGEAMRATASKIGLPNGGPQLAAYVSKADVLLFGGSPGGGKSILCILLALNEHHRSLLVRSNFTDLEALIDNTKKIVGTDDGFVGGSRPKYKKPDGGVIHFMGLPEDGGIGGLQGVDHDFIGVDEAATAHEDQIRLIMGWLRTDRPGQRTRVVFASNPPLDSRGDWLTTYFAPWLDPKHPNPAKPGELRWFLPDFDNGGDRECGVDDFVYMDGVTDAQGQAVKIRPQSRTFIPSKFTDNPYYTPEDYAKQLAGLPDAAREILMSGNFMLERADDIWQTIPTKWVKDAQERWYKNRPSCDMSCLATDIAQGGADMSVVATRYDYWFDELKVKPGTETPEGIDIATMVIKHRRDQSPVVLDMGGGYGGAAKVHLDDNNIKVIPFKGVMESFERSEDGMLGFVSRRSEIWWKFKEALDPDQPGGSKIALPPDNDLAAELTSPKYQIVRHNGKMCVKIEPKEMTRKKMGRSTDRADTVLMCWAYGEKGTGGEDHPGSRRRQNRAVRPKIVRGYQNRK